MDKPQLYMFTVGIAMLGYFVNKASIGKCDSSVDAFCICLGAWLWVPAVNILMGVFDEESV